MSNLGEPIPGTNNPGKELSAKIESIYPTSELIKLEKKTPGLGGFIRLLDTTNQVRKAIDTGKFDNGQSQQVYDDIWQMHTGNTIEDKALAFSEGGGYPIDEWINALSDNTRPIGSYGSVRVIQGTKPMLFDLPRSLKPEVTKLFFQMADRFLENPDQFRHAYIPVVKLQTQLNFLHPKVDGNGRTTEDWMLWWQKKLVENSEKIAKTRKQPAEENYPVLALLGDSYVAPAVVTEDTIRSWFHHGLRYNFGDQDDPLRSPPFLKNEYVDQYKSGRQTMLSRTEVVNGFRRDMYTFLSEGLGYEGDPIGFEIFINEHQLEVIKLFDNLYSDYSTLSSLPEVNLRTDKLQDQLAKTGPYSYIKLKAIDLIKPEFLPLKP